MTHAVSESPVFAAALAAVALSMVCHAAYQTDVTITPSGEPHIYRATIKVVCVEEDGTTKELYNHVDVVRADEESRGGANVPNGPLASDVKHTILVNEAQSKATTTIVVREKGVEKLNQRMHYALQYTTNAAAQTAEPRQTEGMNYDSFMALVKDCEHLATVQGKPADAATKCVDALAAGAMSTGQAAQIYPMLLRAIQQGNDVTLAKRALTLYSIRDLPYAELAKWLIGKDPKASYAGIFYLVCEADELYDKGLAVGASNRYALALTQLEILHATLPDWNKEITKYRINYCRSRMGITSSVVNIAHTHVSTPAAAVPAPASREQVEHHNSFPGVPHSLAFKADAAYCTSNGTLVMQGNCEVRCDEKTLRADTIHIGGEGASNLMYASGSVCVPVRQFNTSSATLQDVGTATCAEAVLTRSHTITLRGSPVCITRENGECLRASTMHLSMSNGTTHITCDGGMEVVRASKAFRHIRQDHGGIFGINSNAYADRAEYDRQGNITLTGNCVIRWPLCTLHAGIIQVLRNDNSLQAYKAVRVTMPSPSPTGEPIVAVSTEARIDGGTIVLRGSPTPVLYRDGKYVRSTTIAYVSHSGVWQFDRVAETSTEPPQDMRALFVLPNVADRHGRADAGLSTNGINWIEKLGLDKPAPPATEVRAFRPIMFRSTSKIGMYSVIHKGRYYTVKEGGEILDGSNAVYRIEKFTEKSTNIVLRGGTTKTKDVSELVIRDLVADTTFVAVLNQTNYVDVTGGK